MHDDLATLQTEVTAALAGLSATETQIAPTDRPEKWSIQQIAEHLILSYRATIPVIETRISKRSPTRAVPTLPQRLGQFMIITLGRFPGGRSAPPAVNPSRPSTLRSGEELAQRIRTELTALDPLCVQGEHLFGSRRAASHMVLGPLSMAQWRRFHLVHGRHHIRQILALRKQAA